MVFKFISIICLIFLLFTDIKQIVTKIKQFFKK